MSLSSPSPMTTTARSVHSPVRAFTAAHRTALPDAVVAFRLDGPTQWALVDALAGTIPLRNTGEVEECRIVLEEYRSAALVVHIPRTSSSSELATLLALRERFPLVPMTGVFSDITSDLSAVARLGAAGIVDILHANSVKQAQLVQSVLSRGHAESLVSRIWRMTALAVPEPASTLLRPAVRLAHSPITLPGLAAATKLHERSLRKYCQTNALPSPQWIIGWARMLVLAYYLEETGRSIQSIAGLLGFASPALLANHVRRYTGLTATALRARAPLTSVARVLEEALIPRDQHTSRKRSG